MDRRSRAAAGDRKSRRRKTILITAAVVAVVIALLFYEQVALLYVLSTLSVVALLIIVAWSNIEGTRQVATEPPPLDDSASVGSGISAAASQTPGAQTRRAGRSRR